MGTETTGNPNPFLDTVNWQGVDDEPTAGSENLVKSGGVEGEFFKLKNKTEEVNKENITNEDESIEFTNDEETETYAKIDSNGLSAKSLKFKSGNNYLDVKDSFQSLDLIKSNKQQTEVVSKSSTLTTDDAIEFYKNDDSYIGHIDDEGLHAKDIFIQNSKTGERVSIASAIDSAIIEKKVVNMSFTDGYHYDSSLTLVQDANAKYCEVDVSELNGCLAILRVAAYDSVYCGFEDEDGTNIIGGIQSKIEQYNDGYKIVIPIPAEFTNDSVTYKGATKMKISSIKGVIEESLEIVKNTYIDGIYGKNIVIIGHSGSDAAFTSSGVTGIAMNYGWWFLMLQRMLHCTVKNHAKSSMTWQQGISQYDGAYNLLSGKVDIVFCNFGVQDSEWGEDKYVGYNETVAASLKSLCGEDTGLSSEYGSTTLNGINALQNIVNKNKCSKIFLIENFFTTTNNVYADNQNSFDKRIANRTLMKGLADVYNCQLINLMNCNTIRTFYDRTQHIFTTDGIHARTAIGGRVIFEYVFGELLNSFITSNILKF